MAQATLLGAAEAAQALDRAHLARVLGFLRHPGDKFFAGEVHQLASTLNAAETAMLVGNVEPGHSAILQRVAEAVRASVITMVRLMHLQHVFRSISAPQLLALHRAVDATTSRDQTVQLLTGVQRVLHAQPLANLRNLHQMYQEADPNADLAALAKLLGVGPEGFFLVGPVRQLLLMDMEELKAVRETLSSFTAPHLALLADLLALANFDSLELRSVFVPVMLDEPEAFMGGGFALGMSGDQHPMDVRTNSDDEADVGADDDDDAAIHPLRVEIVEQPPSRCVYRRNLKPSPVVRLRGPDSVARNRNLFVCLSVLRCDSMEHVDDALEGDTAQRVAAGTTVTFSQVKMLKTSHQLDDSHVALRVELREYDEANKGFEVLHSMHSVPFMVLSHTTQLKRLQHPTPSVEELIPSSGNVGGGTQVVVLGNNFFDSPGIRVRFDDTDVMPTYHGPRTLVCLAPPRQRGAGEVAVRVCNEGQKWGAPADRAYAYVDEPDAGTQPPTRVTAPPLVAAGPVVGAAPRGAAGGMFADMPLFVDLRQSTGGLMELGFSTDGADLAYMLSGGQ